MSSDVKSAMLRECIGLLDATGYAMRRCAEIGERMALEVEEKLEEAHAICEHAAESVRNAKKRELSASNNVWVDPDMSDEVTFYIGYMQQNPLQAAPNVKVVRKRNGVWWVVQDNGDELLSEPPIKVQTIIRCDAIDGDKDRIE